MKKEGISLIVLVITIIVMIILASSVLFSLNNNNTITNASIARQMNNANELKDEVEMYRNSAVSEGKEGVETFPILKQSSGNYETMSSKATADSKYILNLAEDLKTALCNLAKEYGEAVTSNLNDKSNYSNFYIINSKLINSTKSFNTDVIVYVGSDKYTLISLEKGYYTSEENESYIITTISTNKTGIM